MAIRDIIDRRDLGNNAGMTKAGYGGRMSGKRNFTAAGFVSGGYADNFVLPSPNSVVLFDDFLGDVLQDPWNPVEGTDTDGTQLVLAGGIGGNLRLTSGNDDANGTQATDASGVTSYLNWQASNGGLTLQTRVKLSRITLAYLFVGFTDVITAELPVISAGSADTVTTNATDGVGVMFDTNMTTDTFWFVGVKGDTDATKQNLAIAPVADDYLTIRIEIDSAGGATVFIHGQQYGAYMADAVTPGTDLTPCIYVSNADGTSVVTLDIDYIHVSMNRAVDGDVA
jgi:hypothetical protein